MKKNHTLAIVGLILNILILPGLGSLIGGKTKQGVWQIALVVGSLALGFLLTLTIFGAIIGIPLIVGGPMAGWIWSLVTGIQMIQET